jgi:GGDEF domain-containing protein
MSDALLRARAALAALPLDPVSPMGAAIARAARWAGGNRSVDALLDGWWAREPGGVTSSTRYRWDTSHKHCPLPPWVGPVNTWRAWHPSEQSELDRDPVAFEERLNLPIIGAEATELLLELDPLEHPRARAIFEGAEPALRRDLAQHVLALHSWTDTFALACVVRCPRATERLRPLLVALATTYAEEAHRAGGCVRGTRYPFHDKPLASATAQLGLGLLRLGLEVPLLARLVESVRDELDPSGGWGDAKGPPDVLTTFACAELLTAIDPGFDPAATVRWFVAHQREDGLWSALGPEAPWLTWVIARWLERAERPFAARFVFPTLAPADRDRKTGLAFFSYFDDLGRLFGATRGLGQAKVELAFLDLAGFRAFNNRHGQDAGDAVLAEVASALGETPAAVVVRDGGDEFLVVGAPTRTGLADDLDAFRRAWPARFRARFGDVPPVASRILVTSSAGADLMATRERLGRSLGPLKNSPAPGAEGLLARV